MEKPYQIQIIKINFKYILKVTFIQFLYDHVLHMKNFAESVNLAKGENVGKLLV